MIKFDLFSNIDTNGFVRLVDVPKFKKFIDIWDRRTITTPTNPEESLYKDYSVKTLSIINGEYEFAEVSEAEMFIKRIKKYLPTGWVLWSTFPQEKQSDYSVIEYTTRSNTIMGIYDYSYCNTHNSNERTLIIKYVTLNGSYEKVYVNIDDLDTIVFKALSDEEINICHDFTKILRQKPSPKYEFMIMKETYKNDYKLYLDDCKKYGFKPLDKILIDNICVEMNSNNGTCPTTFRKDGMLGGYPYSDDIKIVNED